MSTLSHEYTAGSVSAGLWKPYVQVVLNKLRPQGQVDASIPPVLGSSAWQRRQRPLLGHADSVAELIVRQGIVHKCAHSARRSFGWD